MGAKQPARSAAERLEHLSPTAALLVAIGLTLVIGFLDYLAGPEVSSAIFYVLPIALAAWRGPRSMAFALSLLAAAVWYASGAAAGRTHTHPYLAYWNTATRLATFLLIAYLLAAFRSQLTKERQAADSDPLTGACNFRCFYQHAAREIERSRRFGHPFTLAYLDLDNFKAVNDTFGHGTGDELLCEVVRTMQAHTRKIDIVARLGGDEFALLFIETGEQASREAIESLRRMLNERMQEAGWPVTVSIGMVTYQVPPRDVAQMLEHADALMYAVKKSGKNNLMHSVWKGEVRLNSE